MAIPVLYATYKGFRRGLIIEVFTLLALFVGLYIGIHFSDAVAMYLKNLFNWDSPYLPVVSFTLVFLGLGAMIYFAGKTIERVVKVVHLSLLNKTFGSLFGLLKALYFISVTLVLIESYDENGNVLTKEQKEESFFFTPLRKVSEYTVPGLSDSKLFLKKSLNQDSTTQSNEAIPLKH
jgi:membrane protein required for colicin V production